jgi:hypothetical protein
MLRHVVRTVTTGLTGYMRTGTGKELGLKYDFIYVYRLGYFYTILVKKVQKMHFKVRHVYHFPYNNTRTTKRVFAEFGNRESYLRLVTHSKV